MMPFRAPSASCGIACGSPGWPRAVAAYFSPAEDFAGLSFSCLGSNPREVVTASDLLAVSLLDIAWRPEAVRQLLDTSAAMVVGAAGRYPQRHRPVGGL